MKARTRLQLNIQSAAIVALVFSSSISAGETIEMKVQATVLSICKIQNVNNIEFGVLDPSQATNVTASGAILLLCTKGVDFRLSVNSGLNYDAVTSRRRMRSDGSFFLPYTLASDALSGQGKGFSTPVTMNISASILGGDYRDLPASSYFDTIKITLEP